METFDLKDMLKSGMSPDELMERFTKQLAADMAAVEQENMNEELDVAREDMVEAIFDYGEILGIVPSGNVGEMKQVFIEAIKEAEREIKSVKPLLDIAHAKKCDGKKRSDRSSDDIIGEFLKSLR